MSALTKIFVVLLVICSLLLTAGIAVFVNRVEDYRAANTAVEAQNTVLKQQNAEKDNALAAANAATQKERLDRLNAVADQQKVIADLEQKVNGLQVQLAEAGGKAAQQMAQLTNLTGALNASEATKDRQGKEIADLRGVTDKQMAQISDLNKALSDNIQKVQATQAQWQFATEQLSDARKQMASLRDTIQKAGLQVSAIQANPPYPANNLIDVKGVIRDVKDVEGIKMATISLGSVDGVKPKMQFQVVSRENGGQWLGTLTVDKVDANESVGRLNLKDDAAAAAIQPNKTEVLSQL